MYGRSCSPAGRNMLRCGAQRYSCALEDLMFFGSVRSVVNSYVRKCLTIDQLQTAGLLQECVMVRDGLAHLPDAFTAGDMSFIA